MPKLTAASSAALALALALSPITTAHAGGEPQAQTAATPGDVIATFAGGSLRRADYESWRTFHELEDTPGTIREMAYVTSMAAASRQRGAEAERRAQLELEATRQRLLIAALRQHVADGVTVSDGEVEALRQENPEALQRPRKVHLRNLYKSLGEPGDEATASAVRQRMAELHRQLAAGADFEQLAQQESESQSRFRGGDLGFLALEDLPPAVAAVLGKLQPGQLSPPIETGLGISIFRCEEIRKEQAPTVEEVRSRLRERLLRQRGRDAWSQTQEQLLAAAAPRLDPDSTSTVLAMDGYQLSAPDLAALIELRAAARKIPVTAEAPLKLSRGQREALLRDWALGVLCARRAVELGLDQEPKVAAALRWSALDVLGRQELVHRVEARLHPATEAELHQAYDASPQRFQEPPAVELALIQLGEPQTENPQRLKEALEVSRQLEAGEITFDEAARRYSIHPSATRGGYLGWLPQRQMVNWGPTVIQAIKQLQPGERSGLLHLESGLWIFELRGRRPPRTLPFEEVREAVDQMLHQRQIKELELTVRQEQLAAIRVELVAAPDGVS